jgi:uncharacterized membrane protein
LRAEKALKIFLKKLKKVLDKSGRLCYTIIRKREGKPQTNRKGRKKMEKFVSVAVVVLAALAVLGVNVGIIYTLFTDFCWIGLLYVPAGLLMWALPYLMYELLID